MPTRRANDEGSVFRRKADGKWIAQISVRQVNGKRRRISRVARSREHARLLLRELKMETPTKNRTERITVGRMLTGWLESVVKPNRAATTFESYRLAITNHIIPDLGEIICDNLTPLHLREWIVEMEKSGKGRRTQQNAFAVLSAALTDAARMGVIPSNPCAMIERPKYDRKDIRPFSDPEVEAILRHTQDDRLYALYHIALRLGMREGEMFGLKWSDIDFEKSQIRVERQACQQKGGVVIRHPKTKAGRRTITVDEDTLDALLRRRAMAMAEGQAACEFVFPTRHGKVIQRCNFANRQWKPLLKKLGIAHRGMHHCRHTAATTMLSAGVPIHEVAGILGHSKPSVTLDLYSHYIPRLANSVANQPTRANRKSS